MIKFIVASIVILALIGGAVPQKTLGILQKINPVFAKTKK
jgi:hypothetical protein